MDQAELPLPDRGATTAHMQGALGHPGLVLFNKVGGLLVQTGLPPETPVFDLLMRFVEGDDPVLSAAVANALARGLDMAGVNALRAAHCGEIDPKEVAALVEAAHHQAETLTARLTQGVADTVGYGVAIAASGAELREQAPGPAALSQLIERLGAATASMVEANGRLQGELALAAEETGKLQDKLRAAETVAVTDQLTGVLNRRGTFKQLVAAQAAATTASAGLCVAMIDLDHFKRINDRFGHAMGDQVLRYVANHLSKAAGETGIVGRLGGEEFLVILPGYAMGAATVTVDSARASLASQIIRRSDDGSSLGRVSFSAGVAQDRSGETPDALISRADAALYDAKRMGRDRVVPAREDRNTISSGAPPETVARTGLPGQQADAGGRASVDPLLDGGD